MDAALAVTACVFGSIVPDDATIDTASKAHNNFFLILNIYSFL